MSHNPILIKNLQHTKNNLHVIMFGCLLAFTLSLLFQRTGLADTLISIPASTLQRAEYAKPIYSTDFTPRLIQMRDDTQKKKRPSTHSEYLMVLAGLDRQLDALPKSLLQALERSSEQGIAIPMSLVETLKQAIQNSFVSETLKKNLTQYLEQNLTPKELKMLLSWYSSDLGRKIIALETNASTEEGVTNMFLHSAQLMSDSRLLPHAQRIDELIGATEFTLRLQNLTQRAIFTATSKGLYPNNPIDFSQFDQLWAKQSRQIRMATNQLVLLTYAYSYQDLSADELDTYTRFLQSPVATKFNQVTTQGIEALLSNASERMVAQVVEKPKKSPFAY